jgi:probable F420-dependent oxidoreductase
MMDLGRVGLWTHVLDMQPIERARDLAVELEAMGWGAILVPEMAGRDPLVFSGLLLDATERIVVGTGIAGIFSRDALTMNGGHRALTEAFPDRFLLGLGVSHAVAVEGLRGHTYDKPLTRMREYLDAMDAAPYFAYRSDATPVRVLAALGPKMLDLAAARASGAHPYFVPVEHTAVAREHLGAGKLLLPEQKVVLETDPSTARAVARRAMAVYLGLPNYTNNLRRFGFDDDDFADGGSDRLVDAIVAWGDEDAIRARVDAHHAAGADHVALQVLSADAAPDAIPLLDWRRLADALLP